MRKINKKHNIKENTKENNEKISLEYNLDIEKKYDKTIEKYGYDFVPRSNHWLSVDEQKAKVNEIEEKTKK